MVAAVVSWLADAPDVVVWYQDSGVQAGLVSLAVALLGALTWQVRRVGGDAREAKEQVKNTHTVNMRDDIDSKHGEVTGLLVSHFTGLETRLGQLGADMARMRETQLEILSRLHSAECEHMEIRSRLGGE